MWPAGHRSSGQLSGSGSGHCHSDQLQTSTEQDMQNLGRSLRTLETPPERRALALYARAPTRRDVMRLKVACHVVQPLRARPVDTPRRVVAHQLQLEHGREMAISCAPRTAGAVGHLTRGRFPQLRQRAAVIQADNSARMRQDARLCCLSHARRHRRPTCNTGRIRRSYTADKQRQDAPGCGQPATANPASPDPDPATPPAKQLAIRRSSARRG